MILGIFQRPALGISLMWVHVSRHDIDIVTLQTQTLAECVTSGSVFSFTVLLNA